MKKFYTFLLSILFGMFLGQSPGGVSTGNTVWFKANAGATVSTWTNQVANTLTTLSANGTTTINASGYNFNPTYTFSGSGRYSSASIARIAFLNTNRYSFFVVSRLKGASGMLFSHYANNASRITLEPGAIFHNAVSTSITTGGINNPVITEASFSTSTGLDSGNNGLLSANSSFTTALAADSAPFRISTQTGTNFPWNGDIAEIVMYNEATSLTDRARIRSYLALKYGITLDQTAGQSYIASDGTTKMWDHTVTNASSYNKNIAGIGRDNNSALNQKQSQSQNPDVTQPVISAGTMVANNSGNGSAIADMQFLSWGDNGLARSYDTPISSPGDVANRRFASIWKIQKTVGFTNTVTINLPTTNSTSPIYLVRSNDEIFDATDTWIQLQSTTVNGIQYMRTPSSITVQDGEYFTFAKYSTGPGGVDGVSLWYRSDNGVTVIGTNTTGWANQAGGYDLTYSSSAYHTYNTTTKLLNFNPSISTTGTSASLKSDIIPNNVVTSGNTPYYSSHFTVFSTPIPSTDGTIYRHNNNGTSGTFSISGSTSGRMLIANRFNAVGNPVANQATMYSMVGNAGASNPTGMGQRNGIATGTSWSGGSALGSDNTNSLYFGGSNADVGELIVYNTAKNSEERQRIESYLAVKYGITMNNGNTNYLNTISDIVWSTSTNTGYNNNIFGIARDNATLLYQKQSRSVNSNQKLIIGAGTSLFETNTDNTNALTDTQFLLAGDNGLAQSYSTIILGTLFQRFDAIWKVQNTNNVGQVTLAWPQDAGISLVQSADANIESTDTFTPMTATISIGGVTYNTATVMIDNESYFTFAKKLEDTDGDGVPDIIDLDNDNDGILDTEEGYTCGPKSIPASVLTTDHIMNYTFNDYNGIKGFNFKLTSTGNSQRWVSPAAQFNMSGIDPRVNGNKITYEFDMAVDNLKFWVGDLDGLENVNINFYDKNGNRITNLLPYAVVKAEQILGNITFTTDAIYGIKIATTNSSNANGNQNYVEIYVPGSISKVEATFVGTNGVTPEYHIGNMCAKRDTDGDRIPDYLDLDSDNDSCFDAAEGTMHITDLNPNGSITGAVDTSGVPVLANGGQGIGSSQDSTINSCFCTKPGATGTALKSSVGILTKDTISIANWPENVPNGYLVLDGASKGMVITSMTTAQILALTPVKGMIVYDTDVKCVKVYRGTIPSVNSTKQGWGCIEKSCNE